MPTTSPIPNRTKITGTVFAGSPSISFAATTAVTVTSEPTERSNSPGGEHEVGADGEDGERRGGFQVGKKALGGEEVLVQEGDPDEEDQQQGPDDGGPAQGGKAGLHPPRALVDAGGRLGRGARARSSGPLHRRLGTGPFGRRRRPPPRGGAGASAPSRPQPRR